MDYISSDELTAANAAERLGSYHGIILPGGFGHRGAEGMMAAANFARTKGIPCLMIGYGMQLGVVEAVRSLLSLPDANSTEVNRLANPAVVAIPRDRVDENDGRQNARMGGMDVVLTEGSRTAAIYGLTMVHERHGNRYEVDDAFLAPLHEVGVDFVGTILVVGRNKDEFCDVPEADFLMYHLREEDKK